MILGYAPEATAMLGILLSHCRSHCTYCGTPTTRESVSINPMLSMLASLRPAVPTAYLMLDRVTGRLKLPVATSWQQSRGTRGSGSGDTSSPLHSPSAGTITRPCAHAARPAACSSWTCQAKQQCQAAISHQHSGAIASQHQLQLWPWHSPLCGTSAASPLCTAMPHHHATLT
jgi:hypothetical protein